MAIRWSRCRLVASLDREEHYHLVQNYGMTRDDQQKTYSMKANSASNSIK